MRRLLCAIWGHENIWTLDPLNPGETVVVCLRCRDRAWSYRGNRPESGEGR